MANIPLYHINLQSIIIVKFNHIIRGKHNTKSSRVKRNQHLQRRELLPIEVLIEAVCGALSVEIYKNTVLVLCSISSATQPPI